MQTNEKRNAMEPMQVCDRLKEIYEIMAQAQMRLTALRNDVAERGMLGGDVPQRRCLDTTDAASRGLFSAMGLIAQSEGHTLAASMNLNRVSDR